MGLIMENQHLKHISALCYTKNGEKGPLYGFPIILFTCNDELVHACIKISDLLGFDGLGLRVIDYLKDTYNADRTHYQDSEWFAKHLGKHLADDEKAQVYQNVQASVGLRPKDIPMQFKCPEVTFGKGVSLKASAALQFSELSNLISSGPQQISEMMNMQLGTNALTQLLRMAKDVFVLMTADVYGGKLNQEAILNRVKDVKEAVVDAGSLRAEYEQEIKLAYQFKVNGNSFSAGFDEYLDSFQTQLRLYADSFNSIPAYNEAHLAAKQISVKLANEDFEGALTYLTRLEAMCELEGDAFIKSMIEYEGKPLELIDISPNHSSISN